MSLDVHKSFYNSVFTVSFGIWVIKIQNNFNFFFTVFNCIKLVKDTIIDKGFNFNPINYQLL